jgi:hypothetical protein
MDETMDETMDEIDKIWHNPVKKEKTWKKEYVRRITNYGNGNVVIETCGDVLILQNDTFDELRKKINEFAESE